VSGDADIAIVGMAGRFPGAANVAELWQNLRDGVESVRALDDEELLAAGVAPARLADPNLVKAVAMPRGIDLFDAGFFGFSHREAEIMDPQQRLLLECAWEALEDAGYGGEPGPGATAVFAGVSTSTYLLYHLLANPAVLATLDPLQLDLGNSGDYLTTRISHKLNLTGPSYLVQCACSTALVAVHAACQSLLAEECDMALAGSASINVGQLRGYWYQEGGIVSRDGHCRAFDASAQGSIVGSGLGLVVLKRLADALADRDSIRAVIRGSAVNNDGAQKVGYTAPSVAGQARVIAEALACSGVAAGDISYVEAHGTGTALGDPIEIEALQRAFQDAGGRRSCALGSVKTNLGHLATAAGIAGLIKTVLALEHRLIPPSLHFERPNPEIDFSGSPFYVNTDLSPWPANGRPRRAGVSSFGFGGTNAHLVLEEAPAAPAPGSTGAGAARPYRLLRLSARSPAALDTATANLAAHLRTHPDLDLADAAYTLARGRRSFAHRRVLVCRDREEAAARLAEPAAEGVLTGSPEGGAPGVAFLFPGLGDQHPQMARGLYETEPAFRAEVDRACELLLPRLGADLREILFAGEAPREEEEAGGTPVPDLRRLVGRDVAAAPPGEASRRLDRTLFAQPAVFVVEHALARLWMEWGIEPRAMIGYSLGELTAAAIAGVLSFEDALRLVAERARLIEELPPGAMLAAPLPADEMRALLGAALAGPGTGGTVAEVWVAADNTPQMCVAAGTESAVSALAQALDRRGVAWRRLRTSHAFHTPLMAPVAERLAECAGRLALRPPRIPYLSNVTGSWITAAEATDPRYWGRHLCQPVRFAAGLGALLAEPGRLLVEVGPGQTLGTFARQHPAGAGATAIHCLSERGGSADQAALLAAVGRLWLAGVEVDGASCFGGGHAGPGGAAAAAGGPRRVPLPTYPFERRRYWIDPVANAAAAAAGTAGPQPGAGSPEAGAPGPAPGPPAGLAEHPRPALRNAYLAPRDETERTVAAFWQTLLGVGEVGVHDDFFELGGHSFLATRLAAELRRSFGCELPMQALFEKPTVAGFAAAVAAERLRRQEAAAPAEPLPRIAPDPAARHLPFALTDVQQAYWLGRGDAFALGGVATHLYAEIDARGIDLERLARAFRALIARHDMLRAVVHADGRQQILPAVPPYRIGTLDLRGSPAPAAGAALADVRRRLSHQVLPSDRWPLFELRATLLAGDRVRLHLSFDFLIGDAWSLHLLLRELGAAYRHSPAAAEPAPLALSFRDYVLAAAALEEGPAWRRALAYWMSRAADFPPAPDLPLAKSPAAVERPTFVRHSGRLAAAEWRRLEAHAARHGLTPSGVLLAAFAEVLTVWARSPRFAINLTLFNRLPLHPEVDALVGDFTSLTLLAVDNSAAASFAERARRIQRQLFADLDHGLVGGIRVQREIARRQGGRAPATMPVVFTSTLNLVPEGETLAGLGEAAEWGYAISQTPQVWLDHQVFADPHGLTYNWDVVEELFPPGLIADMRLAYDALLARLAGEDEAVWQQLHPVLPPRHQLALFAAANATAAPLAAGLLHAPFFARAASDPERPAVIAADRTLTYGELAGRAQALAGTLRASGAAPGSLVAVAIAKGWEQAVAVFAVLAAGAAYLPIDPELPRERRWYLLENGGVSIVLTRQPAGAEGGEGGDGARGAEPAADAGAPEWPPAVRRLVVPGAAPAAGESRPPLAPQRPTDLAYVIYTSGSTGRPKGVMIDHRGALNTVADVNERFGAGPDDRVLSLSALSFDLSVYDLFGPLAAGGAVVLPDAGRGHDPEHWAELAARHRVTIWNTVPALLEILADYADLAADVTLPSLRLVLLSGDWIPLRLPERIRRFAGDARIVSLGGATEASIWSILFPIGEPDPAWRSIPYGRPLRNQRWRVLDGALAPRPVWVPGQLYIGGAGLARGYWADAGKTAASFVPDPDGGGAVAPGAPPGGERLYRTGDLGRYLPDGSLEFLGREDFQVKLGGFRIELGEIEAALARHPAVREALAAVWTGAGAAGGAAATAVPLPGGGAPDRTLPRDRRLTAWYVPAPGTAPSAEELRAFLAEQLPAYMVPADLVPLAAFPLTANGKLDRHALPAPARGEGGGRREYVAPSTDVEEAVAQLLAETLGVERVSVHDSFFDLGGDSLLAVRTIFRLRQALAVQLPVRSFFAAPTVAALAATVEELLLEQIEELSDAEAVGLLGAAEPVEALS